MTRPLEINFDSLPGPEQKKYIERILEEVEGEKLEKLENERHEGLGWSERHEY